MPQDGEAVEETRKFRLLGQAGHLNRTERIAVLIAVTGIAAVDLFGFLSTPDANLAETALSIATTVTFALYIWSPLTATCVLALVVLLSHFVSGTESAALAATAVAAGLVLRVATTPHIIGYGVGILIATGAYTIRFSDDEGTLATVLAILSVAVVAGGIGLALRMSNARGQRLASELAESAEREREAILAERRWIAGELHDSIAHHLTVIAMHIQLVDDDQARATSQSAIQVSARKALSDLRFVIELAEDAPRGTAVPSGDLADAIDEAREEFEAAGHPVTCDGDPNDERIPRGAEIILARIVRESATNVLKYAGPGEVRFILDLEPEHIELNIRSPLPDTPRRDLPSTGTGLNRMAERVLGVSGAFSAGPDDGSWLVSVRLPLA